MAKRYNMTPDALRKLNQFRTFARGWESLRTGDELDVPVAPLPPVLWEGKDKPGSTVAATSQDAGAHRVAGLASQAGGFLSSSARGEAAASMARGMATGAVGGEVQQWLSQFGTARVQLDADKKLSLKNSSLDLLVPLHEKKDRLVFAQGSVHRTDERTQTNLGVRYRWFNDGWMLGGNTFLDYDLSRSHTRMGGGVNGLAAKVQTTLKDDPMSGHIFIFRGRSGSQVKLLWSTGDGLCLLTKRLERGRFAWPSARDGKVFLTPAQLAMLMEGIDWRQPKRLLTSLTML
ncbi:IS66 family insertion sequence element accessory protein TnpB [Serratia marcescens]|uniref:IS66 family insertion sequence element accessory protein TnpB n=1 Tax=Serratia marcescens TaxID=615 RepID=UPI003FA6850A